MDMNVLNELCGQLASMVPAFKKQHGCPPTVAIVPAALMRRLVGAMPNCMVYVSGLIVLADPTAEAIRLTALEIPDSLKPTPPRPESDTLALH